MGSHRVCLWDPRTGHMLRLTLADGIPRTLLLRQVINLWDPRAFFMGSQAKSHAYSLPWLTKSQKQFYYAEWFIHGILNCIYRISCYITCALPVWLIASEKIVSSQVIYLWDPKVLFMGSHDRSHAQADSGRRDPKNISC